MHLRLDITTQYILDTLESEGFSAYVVGGFLRDLLLGNQTQDTDIASNALPDQVKKLFENYTVIDTGLKHGTVTLLINHVPYEITTFRTEGVYSDSRRPDFVEFTDSIELDLKRRDFTVNALAYNNKSGLIDLFGGLDDLNNKVLRAVGNPKKRFSEDALRIMRGLRFASILGFSIEKETKVAMLEYAHLLNNIAVERIYNELIRTLSGDGINTVLKEYFYIFTLILPGIVAPEKDITPLEVPSARLASLFDNKSHAEAALCRLKADNQTIKKVALLLSSDPIPNDNNKVNIKRFLSRYGSEALDIARFHEHMRGESDAFKRVKGVLESGECFSLGQLAVNGNDITSLGYKGLEVGIILNRLLDRVISGETENTKETLLHDAKNIDNL